MVRVLETMDHSLLDTSSRVSRPLCSISFHLVIVLFLDYTLASTVALTDKHIGGGV
jgi:hypothetical protein